MNMYIWGDREKETDRQAETETDRESDSQTEREREPETEIKERAYKKQSLA